MNGAAVVVDASVALKWVIDEEHTDRARALLTANAHLPILGPPPLASEVSNALYQRLRRKDLTPEETVEALALFVAIGVEMVSPEGLYQQAFDFARSHNIGDCYDALYVMLAASLGLELWTDDRVLLRTLSGTAPWVRWIGDYP